MSIAYLNSNDFSFFSGAQEQLSQWILQLQSDEQTDREHGDIEKLIHKKGLEILRRLLQGWLDPNAFNEETISGLVSSQGEVLNHVRSGRQRPQG